MDGKSLLSGLSCIDCKGFKQLLDTQSLVDCTLACDGGKISAHKLVLSACSSYLAKILLEHPVEHPIIILPELNIEDVKTLVHYMYTGELLKSDTVNSISLLRTAAILSINSLNDLMLTSASSSPGSLIRPDQFGLAHSNSIRPQAGPQHVSPDRLFVDQISPLLAAISQQQHHQLKLHQQAFGTAAMNATNGGLPGFPLVQNENMSLSAASRQLEDAAAGANLSSILGAAAAAAVASVNGQVGCANPAAVAQFYNNLTAGGGRLNTMSPTPLGAGGNLHASSSSSSTSSSPMNSSVSTTNSNSNTNTNTNTNNNNNSSSSNTNNKSSFSVSEPFSYSSAITGMVTVPSAGNTNARTNNCPTGMPSSANTNEFQFKCPVCQNHFQTICSFEYHMQRAHSVTSFGCEICHKPFASLRYVLTDHMRRCHGWKNAAQGRNNTEQEQQEQQKLQC